MQITSISQCKVNQVVYHPVHGKGVIKAINESHPDQALYHFCVFVDFGEIKKWFWSDNIEDSTKHLYLFPIVTISQAEYKALEEAIGSKGFKLIQSLYNPDK